jgi:outer membrane protein, heavy metal efflux system
VEHLGVSEAVSLAYDRNPALQRMQTEVLAKTGEWWMGFGVAAPQLSFFREGVPSGAASAFTEQRWTISQSISFPLKSYYGLRQTSAEHDALLDAFHAERARVRTAVRKAYTSVLFAQEVLDLHQQEVELAGRLVETAAARVEFGEASELEVMKAELERSEAEGRVDEAERSAHAARYALFRGIGLDPGEQRYEIVFPETMVDVDVDVPQELVFQRLDRMPEYAGAEAAVDAARLGVSSARAALLPDLTLEVFRQDFGGGFDARGFQIGLRLPVWPFSDHVGRTRRARALEQAAAWGREAVMLDLKKEAELAWHGYETSRRTIETYRTTVRDRAEDLLALTLEGYQMGEIDLMTLLDTQRTFLASRQRYFAALRDFYFHLIELERFVGEEMVFIPITTP